MSEVLCFLFKEYQDLNCFKVSFILILLFIAVIHKFFHTLLLIKNILVLKWLNFLLISYYHFSLLLKLNFRFWIRSIFFNNLQLQLSNFYLCCQEILIDLNWTLVRYIFLWILTHQILISNFLIPIFYILLYFIRFWLIFL